MQIRGGNSAKEQGSTHSAQSRTRKSMGAKGKELFPSTSETLGDYQKYKVREN